MCLNYYRHDSYDDDDDVDYNGNVDDCDDEGVGDAYKAGDDGVEMKIKIFICTLIEGLGSHFKK